MPESTPLNPRIVGGLDRGDYRIEKIINPLGQELTLSRLRAACVRPGVALEIAVRDRDEQPFVPILERFLSSKRQ